VSEQHREIAETFPAGTRRYSPSGRPMASCTSVKGRALAGLKFGSLLPTSPGGGLPSSVRLKSRPL